MVGTLAVRSGRGTLESKVPFEEIGFERSSVQSWVFLTGELGCFFQDALDGGGFGVEGWKGHD